MINNNHGTALLLKWERDGKEIWVHKNRIISLFDYSKGVAKVLVQGLNDGEDCSATITISNKRANVWFFNEFLGNYGTMYLRGEYAHE